MEIWRNPVVFVLISKTVASEKKSKQIQIYYSFFGFLFLKFPVFFLFIWEQDPFATDSVIRFPVKVWNTNDIGWVETLAVVF